MVNVISTQKFDFNDLLIVPEKTTKINSRYKDVVLPEKLPIMTAPMDTVINMKNAHLFDEQNIHVILPRTETKNWVDYLKIIKDANEKNYFISLSLDMFQELPNKIAHTTKKVIYNPHSKLHVPKPKRILIDIANGHIEKIIDYCKNIKDVDPNIEIMVGSIANPETYRWYAESGVVDYVRCGIGAGNGCLTTKNASIGYPMASLIYECRLIKEELKNGVKLPAIVADGGMKDYSDVIKTLGLGADYVLLGSIFNKTVESAGDNYFKGFKIKPKTAKYLFRKGFKVRKHFRGMSTKEAQKAMGKTALKTSEGIVRYRLVEYTLSGWVENFNHYLRNAMSYTNSKTINDFIGNVTFCKITEYAYKRFDK
jgi:IMP dehydrogenase/GMP reductase